MISTLGGRVTSNQANATHFIVSNYKAAEFNKKVRKNTSQRGVPTCYSVNLKWLFHSYYYLTRMSENEDDYKVE
jgi:hypothetical protein